MSALVGGFSVVTAIHSTGDVEDVVLLPTPGGAGELLTRKFNVLQPFSFRGVHHDPVGPVDGIPQITVDTALLEQTPKWEIDVLDNHAIRLSTSSAVID